VNKRRMLAPLGAVGDCFVVGAAPAPYRRTLSQIIPARFTA
jgi:hypothetical protein